VDRDVGAVQTSGDFDGPGLLRWLGPIVLIVAGNVGLAVWSLAADNKYRVFGAPLQIAIASVGGLALLAGLVLTGRQAARAETFRRERDRAVGRADRAETRLAAVAEAADLALDEHLAELLYELDLGPTERASLYWIDTSRGQFKRSARYCRNPTLRTGGVELLPLGQGVLALALNDANGEYRATLSFANEGQRHEQHAARANLTSSSRVGAMRMKSVEYCAFALTNPATASYGGVLVFESNRAKALKFRDIKSLVHRRESSIMRAVATVEAAAAISSAPSAAIGGTTGEGGLTRPAAGSPS
jgi:hypothetical protein